MTDKRFKLSFSEKALKYNPVMGTIPWTMVCIFSLMVHGMGGLFCLFLALILITYLLIRAIYSYILNHSYIEVSDAGYINVKVPGRKTYSYPIKEIEQVEPSDIMQATKRHAIHSVMLNTRGFEMMSSTGVLITFKRSWIKSVHPVFFNPEDIKGFIDTLQGRIQLSNNLD